jgi:peptidyl-prolyl cis-trans isomerase SurA
MRKLVLSCFAAGLFFNAGYAQTLFTFGNNSVSKEEFLRVYQKNSINKKPDYSEAALREYLDLYSLFRMKVKEAELQHLDTLGTIEAELNNYRKQLAKNYLTDEQLSNKLLDEAYGRMKEEVRIAHIMIMSSITATSADTVAPYHKIDSIATAIKKGADFAQLARQYSEDRGSKDNGGDVGYITALQTVYPFENAAYSTPVGKVSPIFRTQFGYHIVKVLDRRPALGEVKVAQILVTVSKARGEEGLTTARKRVDSIQAEIKKGVPFEQLVKKYSDDKFSVNDDGVLPWFGVGRLSPEFEKAAFSLKKPGDISQPVQTDFGFHIIKLIEKKSLKPLDSLRVTLKRKVDNDSRSQTAREMFFEKMKQKNGFKEYAGNLDPLLKKVASIPDTGARANQFSASEYREMNKPLFALDGVEYKQNDLMKYAEDLTRGRLMGPKSAVLKDIYANYIKTIVTDKEEHRLVEEHEEFKNLMTEYRDGIMLFELMDRNVWGKASRDSAGLKTFYASRKDKYTWEPGFTGSVYRFKNEDALKEGKKLMADKKLKDEDILKKMNVDNNPDAVTIQRGHYEFSKFTQFPRTAIVAGKATEPKKMDDGSYSVVRVDQVFDQPTPKSLEDARGYVVAEYQDYLEKQWNDEIRKKYAVKLNEKEFKSLVK